MSSEEPDAVHIVQSVRHIFDAEEEGAAALDIERRAVSKTRLWNIQFHTYRAGFQTTIFLSKSVLSDPLHITFGGS